MSSQTAGSNNVALGNNVQLSSPTDSNQLNIGNWIQKDSADNWTYTAGASLNLATAQPLNLGATGAVTATARQLVGTSSGLMMNTPASTTVGLAFGGTPAWTFSSSQLTPPTNFSIAGALQKLTVDALSGQTAPVVSRQFKGLIIVNAAANGDAAVYFAPGQTNPILLSGSSDWVQGTPTPFGSRSVVDDGSNNLVISEQGQTNSIVCDVILIGM